MSHLRQPVGLTKGKVSLVSDSASAVVFLYHVPPVLVHQVHYEELSGGHTPANKPPEEER